MKKEKKRMSSLSAITIRISAVIFAIWLLCMAALTIITAQYVYTELREKADDYVNNRNSATRTMMQQRLPHYAEMLPGALEYDMVKDIAYSVYYSGAHGEGLRLLRGRNARKYIREAVAYYKPDGELILCSDNYLYFQYSYEHNWESRADGYAYINMERWGITLDFVEHIWQAPAFKLTGRFEGAEFIPVKAEYDANGNSGTAIRGRDWITFYESAEDSLEDCVTICAEYPGVQLYDAGDPLKYRNKEYANIRELMLNAPTTKIAYSESEDVEYYAGTECSLRRILMYGYESFYDYEEGVDYGEEGPPVAFYMTAAVVGYPLKIAMDDLISVYLFTFAACILLTVLLRHSVKKNFTDPVKLVYKGVSDGWGYVTTSLENKTMWREPYEISRHYRETLDKLRADKNEIARLTTALEYAEEAEEQRRQMSSNIAHELKTPLAVIRSYAEGLQEHIAEEKRDKYLEVIVGETERMDELVLEMLELSRLEAGRVKLARDVCDLSALTRSVFEKLEPAAEAKELTITYQLQKDCLVSADEARILQVIGNFASNALRYTPVGGHIWVRTSMARGYVSLAVENTSPPLSDEVLEKVWERFWRAEEARSEKSSGLGLAIAKSIVELHGGKCSARNTENGVEFAFTI